MYTVVFIHIILIISPFCLIAVFGIGTYTWTCTYMYVHVGTQLGPWVFVWNRYCPTHTCTYIYIYIFVHIWLHHESIYAVALLRVRLLLWIRSFLSSCNPSKFCGTYVNDLRKYLFRKYIGLTLQKYIVHSLRIMQYISFYGFKRMYAVVFQIGCFIASGVPLFEVEIF
jgi:hypothetical protein